MKILLAQNTAYCPARGGSNKSNRILLEALAQRGHDCRAVSTAVAGFEADGQALAQEQVTLVRSTPEVSEFVCGGIKVYAAKVRSSMDGAALKRELVAQIREFDPDWILISSEDPGQILLETAVTHVPAKVVYLARTTLFLSFGPDCFNPSPEKTALLGRAAGIVTISSYLKDYFRRWADLDAEVLPISLFGDGPFPDLGRFADGYVTMVNPCAYKGIAIFLELARAFPHVAFAAVPTWGTTSDDMRALLALKNVTILEAVDDIDKIFSRTRVVLVPSLWAEALSRTIIEAMLRGIPVLASNVGGAPEAKLGVEYVLPVNPIRSYHQLCDERRLPTTDVPSQDIGPWRAALARLLSDRGHYEDVARRSRLAAAEYATTRGGCEKFDEYLRRLKPRGSTESASVPTAPSADATAGLSAARKALLAQRLRQKIEK